MLSVPDAGTSLSSGVLVEIILDLTAIVVLPISDDVRQWGKGGGLGVIFYLISRPIHHEIT